MQRERSRAAELLKGRKKAAIPESHDHGERQAEAKHCRLVGHTVSVDFIPVSQ